MKSLMNLHESTKNSVIIDRSGNYLWLCCYDDGLIINILIHPPFTKCNSY